jgi:hypothetical protein
MKYAVKDSSGATIKNSTPLALLRSATRAAPPRKFAAKAAGTHHQLILPATATPRSEPSTREAQWAAAGSMDTDLSFLSFLELYRTDVPERRVPARRVVEPLDVVEHV